ncbi:prepilin-type N-terminal cleavage/methylation domain-containing protein [Peptoniphilus sp. MSJ-1]|uniref:Prepilin-type N-terminal cleavage/methylation domain-containing protein n=1 Tax=Peptoniphilus ovalis TaxID=2841503 RepID=A0ABS6FIQ1_9FIRM|nr:prepilin-type N-terminal cleavage/methylation domain-containing protein [Peptoniphilus ovalis]MBU5670056.1 prepilin-type N-terminal cleavage/methylation domain-containing protein [Peptoniphilus ovalis]
MKTKKHRGFTLLELVIVIAIIAILISIAAMRYSNTNLAAQAATHNSNVKVIKNAAILYLIDNPEATSVSTENITPYLEGKKMPKPARALGQGSSFSVSVDQSGDVTVSPGLVKVSGDSLVSDNEQ